MSTTPNQFEVAAAPALIAALQAIQQFVTNMGADPAQWTLKFPGASQVLLGTIQMQVPVIAQAEAGVLQTDVNGKLASWIKTLQALQTPAADKPAQG